VQGDRKQRSKEVAAETQIDSSEPWRTVDSNPVFCLSVE